jgi:hypothetical protein
VGVWEKTMIDALSTIVKLIKEGRLSDMLLCKLNG